MLAGVLSVESHTGYRIPLNSVEAYTTFPSQQTGKVLICFDRKIKFCAFH